MKVKICGITSLKDAKIAVEAGADALGFVFYKKSTRYICPKDTKKIIDFLPPFIHKVGLFVNENVNTINQIIEESKISLCQIHFEMKEELFQKIKCNTLPVVRAKNIQDLYKLKNRFRLIDVHCKEYGGSGKRLNLEWFKEIDNSKIILAGGLSTENISEVKKYNFYGVDVSSGVESEIKGKKDYKKIYNFIKKAKE